ncbi:MAG: hypothetical protein LBD53_06275 [Tannerella sp.]|jgi:hypothetical protein|nr:hypothetical protein [Tannerella sp.]
MNGINMVINEKGLKTAILIDLNELRINQTEGRDIATWLETLEDIEDIIDVELSVTDASDNWNDVREQLKLNAYV